MRAFLKKVSRLKLQKNTQHSTFQLNLQGRNRPDSKMITFATFWRFTDFFQVFDLVSKLILLDNLMVSIVK